MEESGWIHCKELLPPPNQKVMVLWQDSEGRVDMDIMMLDESSQDEDAWWCFAPIEL